MTISTRNPVRSDVYPAAKEPGGPARASRAWALSGVVAGLAGIGTIVTSGMVDAVYREDLWGNPDAIAQAVADKTLVIAAFHTFTMVGAVALVLFAAGLHRRLASASPAGALPPVVAFAGLLGTTVVSVLGAGLDTEFMFAFQAGEDAVDPHNMAMFNNWIGTIPWIWVLAGLAGGAVHLVARSGGVPRWIGRVGLVLGGLTLLLGISPMQYMAGLTGPVWLLLTAVGFFVGDRAFRAGR